MIPLFAFLYNRGVSKEKSYSILNIFPYFILGFVGMVIFRNIGDDIFISNKEYWIETITLIKALSKIF